jgi:hypothetical protein
MPINISQFRAGDERRWNIPLFETDITAGVMPLFVNKGEMLYHIGTAFLISSAGVFVTASHVIAEALRQHGLWHGEFPPGEDDLLRTDVKLSALHIYTRGNEARFSIWSVANVQIAHPTDVAFGFLHGVDAPMERASCSVSFDVPAPDSWVQAIGYPTNDLPPIDLMSVRDNRFDFRAYQPTLVAAAGQVRGLVLDGFYPVANGPCLVTDCPTIPGMSGGPVVNESGNVCGVVSANLYLPDGLEGSALSMLYATLPIPVRVVWRPTPQFTMNVTIPIVLAAQRGLLKSDGSHVLHRIVVDEFGTRVDPLIRGEHLSRVFANRRDYWDDRPAQPFPNEPADAGAAAE